MRALSMMTLLATMLPMALSATELPKVQVSNVRRVFHNGEHNAFTDLVRFRDQYYLTFRSCPDGHMVHPTASIIILAGDDTKQWRQVHQFRVAERDTRDPHFLVFRNRLFVYTGTWYSGETTLPIGEYDLNKHLGYAACSDNGEHWTSPIMLEGTFGHYVWRANTFDGKAYLCGRRKHEFDIRPRGEGPDVESALLESNDGLIWRTRSLFQEVDGDETAFQFEDNGDILAVGRRGRAKAQILRSKPPYTEWDRRELDRYIGGPLLVRWGDRWVVGGRKTVGDSGPKTSMYWLVGDDLHEFAELPSGGDTSYPGFVELSPTRAVMSWYSSHEQDGSGQTMTAIYMADLTVQESGDSAATAPPASAASAESLEQEFADPPAKWKSRPLWFWNGPLDRSTTTRIMEQSVASGYDGFGILPTKEMGVAFMSPEFLGQYKHAVDTASRLGLKMCLYDEFWFPSGSAGGLLKQQYPEALSKRLDKVETKVVGPQDVTLDVPSGELMAAVAMQSKTKERLSLIANVHDGRLSWQAPAGPWQVMLFVCVQDGARDLVDYLDPQAVRKFVELTYEKYYQTFPEHFGKTIDTAFYDEPTFHWVQGGRAWTPLFNQRFKEKYAEDPALFYPALWHDIGPETAAARNQMFGLRAELFAEGFVKTLADWCRAHEIELTGHMDQEEIVNPVGLCGDLIKAFQYQPIPGLDQIFAYGRGAKMYKVVSSAAVNYGRPLVMTECYGGMDLPLANLYREAMDQFVKGVNVMVPHAVWYRTDSIVFPPELSYRTQPYAAELPRYNEYIGRLQRVLQQGRPVVDIAVLYPIHGLQAAYHFGPGQPYTGGVIPEWADYMDVGERLSLEIRHDFTYLHPETLEARCRVAPGVIALEQPQCAQRYRLLILPGMEAISAVNLAQVKDYFDQGGKVVATTRLPDRSAELGKSADVRSMVRHIFGHQAADSPAAEPRLPQDKAARVPESGRDDTASAIKEASESDISVNRNTRGGIAWFVEHPTTSALQQVIAAALPQPDVTWKHPLSVQGGHVSYLHKEIEGRQFWFFTNSSDTPVDTTIGLRGVFSLEQWDPHTGQIEPWPATNAEDRTSVQLQLAPVSSVFLVSKP